MAKFRVLVGDSLSAEGLRVFEQYEDIEVVVKTGLTGDELASEVRASDGVVCRSKPEIGAEILQDPGKCKVIGRAGIGVDNIDVGAATKAGVIVMNTPGGNSVTTAEHSLAMLFAVARTLPQAHAKLQAGNWDKKAHSGVELYGKTLGVIGLGNIGGIVADRARGLHMKIMGFDPYVSRDVAAERGIELATLEEIYTKADFITVHVPLTEQTKNLISTEQFKMMKPTCRVVNCARGGIIDEGALVAALDEGEIAGAALDVFESEPLAGDSPLIGHPKIVITPHLGASTHEAQVNVAVQVAEQISAFLIQGDVRNAVNMPALSGETIQALGPHMALGRQIGRLHHQLQKGGLNRVEIKFTGAFVRHDLEPVVREILVGLLDGTVEQPVNAINVREIASARSLDVQVTSSEKGSAYAASIEVTAVSETTRALTGAVFGAEEARIVQFDEFHLDGLEPEGQILVIRNTDRPGVVGRLGAFLGEKGINIARLQVSRNRGEAGEAMMFFQVDETIPAESLQELAGLDDIQDVTLLTL